MCNCKRFASHVKQDNTNIISKKITERIRVTSASVKLWLPRFFISLAAVPNKATGQNSFFRLPKNNMLLSRASLSIAAAFLAILIVGCSTDYGGNRGSRAPEIAIDAGGDNSVSYLLSLSAGDVQLLYPSTDSLPSDYQACYPSLKETIEHYTLLSLQRDGVVNPTVTAKEIQITEKINYWMVTLTPSTSTTQAYATRHPAFLDKSHAWQAVLGVNACKADPLTPSASCSSGSSCSDTYPCDCTGDPGSCTCNKCTSGCWPSSDCPAKQTWAQFLPLGMAMVNQKAVNYLNYPPAVSLIGGDDCGSYKESQQDYLDNFTMCRWSDVLGATGASNPELFETIVDSRPIAAAGSKMQQNLPDPAKWFDSGIGGTYISPMLNLLTTNPTEGASTTLPVTVLGSPAQQAWPEINGLSKTVIDNCVMTSAVPEGQYYVNKYNTPCLLQVGSVILAGNDTPTPFITSNHPDVTSYNCCKGDTASVCSSKTYGTSWDLIEDEQGDFVATCWLEKMAENPAGDLWQTLTSCKASWATTPTPEALCIQAALDNDNPEYKCWSYGDAKAFCQTYNNDACYGIASGAGVKYCGHSSLTAAQAQACPDKSDPTWPTWYQNNCVYEYQNWRLDGACSSSK